MILYLVVRKTPIYSFHENYDIEPEKLFSTQKLAESYIQFKRKEIYDNSGKGSYFDIFAMEIEE